MTRTPGYIALTTVIIISVSISLLAASRVLRSLTARQGEVKAFQKLQSHGLANACLEQGLLNLSLNGSYSGNEVVQVPVAGGSTSPCTLLPILTQGSNKVIRSTASVSGATTNLNLVADGTRLTRISLGEVVGF